jgi:hypothetical protein
VQTRTRLSLPPNHSLDFLIAEGPRGDALLLPVLNTASSSPSSLSDSPSFLIFGAGVLAFARCSSERGEAFGGMGREKGRAAPSEEGGLSEHESSDDALLRGLLERETRLGRAAEAVAVGLSSSGDFQTRGAGLVLRRAQRRSAPSISKGEVQTRPETLYLSARASTSS